MAPSVKPPTAATPELVTVRVTVMVCPTLTVAGAATSAPPRLAAPMT